MLMLSSSVSVLISSISTGRECLVLVLVDCLPFDVIFEEDRLVELLLPHPAGTRPAAIASSPNDV
jgi:hypothetical protein